jgi:hypothetical protein
MSRDRNPSRNKTMKPIYFVFCEGKTEKEYVSMLRSYYRIPIVIDVREKGNDITEKYIETCKQDKSPHPSDKTFLMYDLDAPKMLDRLQKIDDTILLASNPCIEFWFLLHFKNHTAEIDSNSCVREISNRFKNYKKGLIDEKLKSKLLENTKDAVKRAKNFTNYQNPSSTVYLLIESLEEIKQRFS